TNPGVVAASVASDTPISGGLDSNGVVVEGYTPLEGERMYCGVTVISPDYLKSLSIPLVQARDFNEQDRNASQKVTIINEKMARHYFGNTNPIGKRIGLD